MVATGKSWERTARRFLGDQKGARGLQVEDGEGRKSTEEKSGEQARLGAIDRYTQKGRLMREKRALSNQRARPT